MQFTKHCQLEVQVRYYIFLTLPVFHSATKWLSLESKHIPQGQPNSHSWQCIEETLRPDPGCEHGEKCSQL